MAFHVIQYAAQSGAELPFVVEAFARFETVDVLFLMSAYLLTLSYARSALDGTSLLPAREFLFRRAVRIVPLYWIAVTTVWALRNPTLPGDWRDLVEHLLFVQVFDRERIFYTLGPTWSMSLEVMFYLSLVVLGALAVKACRRVDSRRRRVALLLAGTLTLSIIPVVWNSVAFLVADVPFDNWPVYFGPQARFGAFAAGMTLAVIVAARQNAPVFSGAWPTVLRVVGLGDRRLRRGRHRGGQPGAGAVPRHRRRRLVRLPGQHRAGRGRSALVGFLVSATTDLAGTDQLQHLHVARADHDAARGPRGRRPDRRGPALGDPRRGAGVRRSPAG